MPTPPLAVLEAGKRAMAEGPHQYAITWGAPRFRQALINKQRRWMGLDLDPEESMWWSPAAVPKP